MLLSVISLLNEPNTFSPANVDASVMFRDWLERKNNKYEEIVKQQVWFVTTPLELIYNVITSVFFA